MQRRQLIQAASAALAGWSGQVLAQPTAKQASTPADFYADFAKALPHNPRLTPLVGLQDDISCERLSIEGRLPSALKGRFLRNGPSLHQRAGQRYQHWFAGDGMVQQFSFSGQTVSHLGRFVRTSKFTKEQAAGKFLFPAFNTHIDSDERVNGPDAMNPANTNAIEHGGKVLAMWEGGSAYALDPISLNTQGPVTWQDGWSQMPFSAHPKVDPQGHLWNMGGAGTKLVTYHVLPSGQLAKAQIAKLPINRKKSGGMVHDLAVTQRYLVVPIPPVTMHFDRMVSATADTEILKVHADEPLRIWVGLKDDVSQAKLFELPSSMVFHVGNAHEEGDEVVVQLIGGADNHFLAGTAVQIMRGKHADPGQSRLVVARLNLRTGGVTTQSFDDSEEFPRFDPRAMGQRARWLATITSWRTSTQAGLGFHGLRVRDMVRGNDQRFDYGDNWLVEEHIVVPRPGSTREFDAWLIGTAFDIKAQHTTVNVFEASRVADGPIARAHLPYALPLGFHGNFTAI